MEVVPPTIIPVLLPQSSIIFDPAPNPLRTLTAHD